MCQLKSHANHCKKKHVLVCHEHGNDTENQDLPQIYKDRFVMKQPNQLSSFSRDLTLSFYMNLNHPSNSQKMSDQETIVEIKLNSEEISAFENENLLKYSSEMAEVLMANKTDKSYLITDVY